MQLEEFKERWVRDEYLLWERSPTAHQRISALLDDPAKEDDPGSLAGRLLSEGLSRVPTPATRQEAALAIWARLKPEAEAKHAVQVEELIDRLGEDPWAIVYLKKLFKVLAALQGWKSFLGSSYLEE
jgi:hypothetical protein